MATALSRQVPGTCLDYFAYFRILWGTNDFKPIENRKPDLTPMDFPVCSLFLFLIKRFSREV